jgi:phosphoinositide-3-kinase regulatory subunit 4
VVPQIVFLRTGVVEPTARNSRTILPRSTFDSIRSATSRTSRGGSLDHGSTGTPFEDLRRRLATINGSSSSLTLAARETRGSPSSMAQPSTSTSTIRGPPSPAERSGSPTESVVSVANPSALRSNRLQVGSTDGYKAAPAIGSSKTNATGLLEATSKIRDGSPERSGRSSPVSMIDTIRGTQRSRGPSLPPISTYGAKLSSTNTCDF